MMTPDYMAEAIRIRCDELAASGDPEHFLDRVVDLLVFLDDHPDKLFTVISRYQAVN
jgi:hypothetical protein